MKFTYDRRGRLIGETRTGVHASDLSYVYDVGGNRRQKINWLEQRKTIYHYDIDEPNTYGSNNNRLAYYDEFDFGTGADVPVSTTWYYYNIAGNVKRIVTELASASGQYHGIRLGYAQNRQAVTYVIGETWTGNACPQQNHEVQFIREFRYDSGRARYLNRELNPALFQAFGIYSPLTETWTDYDGDEPYGDFSVDVQGGTPIVTNLRSFEPGLAMTRSWIAIGGESTGYYHGDLIGTTRAMTDPTGSVSAASSAVYTAFGESVRTPDVDEGNRYGYAGAWGYQAHTEFPFVHVGARYYDPSTGRFLQRDPIGIAGGFNVYEHSSAPTVEVDPEGLSKPGRWVKVGKYGKRFMKGNRFAKPPWYSRLLRKLSGSVRALSPYVWACAVVRAGYAATRTPWPGYPHEIIAESIGNLVNVAWQWVRDRYRLVRARKGLPWPRWVHAEP